MCILRPPLVLLGLAACCHGAACAGIPQADASGNVWLSESTDCTVSMKPRYLFDA